MPTALAPDKPTIDTFGGVKADFDSVVDSATELSATDWNRMSAQVAMLSMTAPIAWVRCTVSGGAITITDHSAVWGDSSGVIPTASYDAAGTYKILWATTYSDLQATPETHTVAIRAVQVSISDTSALERVHGYEITGASEVYVYVANRATGLVADIEGFTLTVW